MSRITQPVNQVRLTNVAVVRLNRCGIRFEVACYRNKIVDYRQGLETDLSEVLQTERIFTNVTKGLFASSHQILKAFGTSDQAEVCRTILMESKQLQVGDRERSSRLSDKFLEISNIVAEKCIDVRSGRRFTPDTIRAAMKEAEFGVHPTRTVKQQFLDCVKLLVEKQVLPIDRAPMRLSVVHDNESTVDHDVIIVKLKEAGARNISRSNNIVFDIPPHLYRSIDQMITNNDGWRLEILLQCVYEEGEADLETEMIRKGTLQQQPKLQSDVVAEVDDLTNDMADTIHLSDSLQEKPKRDHTKKTKKAKQREKEELARKLERQQQTETEQTKESQRQTITTLSSSMMKTCNTCPGFTTNSVADYRAHFRSDWHRFNQKLKLSNQCPVSLREFQSCDAETFFKEFS